MPMDCRIVVKHARSSSPEYNGLARYAFDGKGHDGDASSRQCAQTAEGKAGTIELDFHVPRTVTQLQLLLHAGHVC